MLIYKDLVGEDQSELLTDAFDIEFKHDFFYEVKSAWCLVGGQTIDIGANSSADGPDDEVDAAEKVINVIDAGQLNETHVATPKAYLKLFKPYMKKVVAAKKANGATDEEVATFKAAANAGAKIVLSTWKERGYQFFVNEHYDQAAMIILSWYEAGAETPTFWFIKDGLIQEKC